MADKKPSEPPKPAWHKNTYFWIGGILCILSVIGMPFWGGDSAIRDPGQRSESIALWILYTVAAAVMLVNGFISHRQTVQQYEEATGGTGATVTNRDAVIEPARTGDK